MAAQMRESALLMDRDAEAWPPADVRPGPAGHRHRPRPRAVVPGHPGLPAHTPLPVPWEPLAWTAPCGGEHLERSTALRERSAALTLALTDTCGRLAATVMALAGTEERIASLHDELACRHPQRAGRYRRVAGEARAAAAHAREIARELSRQPGDHGRASAR